MSRRPKNNHYHFAEQYSDGHYSRKAKAASRLHLPRRSVFFALLVLLVFGVVTTTFSANISDDNAENGSILISVRNAKADRDLAVTGADAELADTGADVDYAPTGAQTYYYKGEGNGSNWTKTAMTVSSDGFYEYYYVSSTTTHQFLIGTSSNENAYNYNYVDAGFNSTNVSNIGDYSKNNCYCWHGSAHYILVYYPNTRINSTSNPKICASTTLPDNAMRIKLGTKYNSTDTYYDMTNSSGTWSASPSLTGGRNYEYWFKVVYGTSDTYVDYYKDLNGATMTYSNCTNWTFSKDTTGRSNTKLTTVTTGSYTFNFTFSSLIVSVVYPKYSISTSVSASSNTTSASTSSVAIGSSVTVTATDSDAAYEFVRWDVTGGTVRTDSYSGTGITTSTSNPLTVYPYGTNTSVSLQAVYKVREYAITYNMDASPATATAGEITNPATNGVPTGDTKTHNTAYTITSNKYLRNGYTQVGWSTSSNSTSTSGAGFYAFGATYSTNAALTLYPVWQLNDPENSNPGYYHNLDSTDQNYSQPKIITTGTMTVGGTVDLAPDLASNSPDVTRSYAYSITGPSGNTSSVGVNSSDSTTFMKFTADTPGTYTVYITVTDVSNTNVTNASNTASAVSNTATISVAPDVPQFTITAYNVVLNDGDRDGATSDTAYRILLGDRYYFSAQIDSTYLANHPTSSYTYTWSTDADFAQAHIVGTGSTITFTNTVVPNTSPHQYAVNLINYDPTHTYNNDPDDPAYDPDPRTLADESHGLESVTLYCRATCNSVSNDSDDHYLWYFIQPLIKSFKYEPMQKIFNLSDQTVTLAAQYNIANDPSYTTRLFFSSSNYGNPWPKALESSGFIEDFTNAIKTYLFPAGTKYFYIEMEGYNSMHELITSVSEKIHTTVGTADSGASRVLYFNNNTAQDLKNYLVMCYYIDGSGALKYQVAQDRNKGDENNEGRNYRVMLPADASAVRFGFLGRDTDHVRYYGSPTIENGEISGFSVPIYYGYTDQITLNGNSYSVINATASTTTSGMQSFTCTAS